MQARRITSKKWTAFPEEFSAQIETVIKENFTANLMDAKLIIDGRIYPEEILLRVGVLEKGRLKQSNFEVSIDYKPDDPKSLDRIHHLVDVAASMMMDYFDTNGEVEFPYSWKEFPFKGHPVFLQYSTENSDLEAQANALLGVTEDTLLVEETPSEDALDRADELLDAEEKDNLH
jgi:hypothetical protein